MPTIVAEEQIPPNQIVQLESGPGQPSAVQTRFMIASGTAPVSPTAFVARYTPGMQSSPHYHTVDEFQVIIEGGGTFGRHLVSPYCVHFARAYTPYGPLQADPTEGWAFITLRARRDAGAQRNLKDLITIPGRRPWQITRKVSFVRGLEGPIQNIPDISDKNGLGAYAINLAPTESVMTPDTTHGDGQFLVVLEGGIVRDGRELRALTIVFVPSHEGAFQICAGPHGAHALALNLPQQMSTQDTQRTEFPARNGILA